MKKCVVISFREGYCSTFEFKKKSKKKTLQLTYPCFDQDLL